MDLRLLSEDRVASTRKRKRNVATLDKRWKRQESTNSTLPEPREGIHQAQVVISDYYIYHHRLLKF